MCTSTFPEINVKYNGGIFLNVDGSKPVITA